MRPFLRWEYLLAKATRNEEAINVFNRYMQNFSFVKYAEFPITIDELRAELKQPPHPDTIQGLENSRGKAFLDAANVDLPGDDVVPKFALEAVPLELREAVLAVIMQLGGKVE